MHHHRLSAIDQPHAAFLSSRRRDSAQRTSYAGFGMRERELHRTVGDAWQQRLTLRRTAAQRDGACRKDGSRQVRFDNHRAAVEATELFRDQKTEQTHRRQALPYRWARAIAACDDRAPLLEAVVLL